MNSNRIAVPIGILAAAILIIIGGYIIFNPGTAGKSGVNPTDNQSGGDYIVPNEGDASSFMPEIKLTSEELKRNAEVPFKAGKKYNYKATYTSQTETVECKDGRGGVYSGSSATTYAGGGYDNSNSNNSSLPPGCVSRNETITTNSETEFYVEKTEIVEGKDCYLVSIKTKTDMPEEEKKQMSEEDIKNYEKMMEQQKISFYYDKETGKTVKIEMSMGTSKMTYTKDMAQFMADIGSLGVGMGTSMFSQWMLSLNEGFRWVQKVEDEKSSGNEKNMAEIEYKAEGFENVNNRECFKVEITFKDKSAKKADGITPIEMTAFAWIDKEKRIIVKEQMKAGGVLFTETNLISEI